MINTLIRWLKKSLSHRATPKSPLALDAQRGSIIVPIAGVIFVGIVLLGSVHLGYSFYMKRELQNTADTAAMSAAQFLGAGPDQNACEAALEAARNNIATNLSVFGDNQKNTITVECGDWDPTVYPGPIHFAASADTVNAIYVHIKRDQPAIMPFMKNSIIAAEAIAHSEDADQIAAFSVGPQLLNLDDGVLTNLLAGIGVDLRGTSVMDYRGLANVKITPSGLLQQLGIEIPADITVGSLNELLSADIGVKALVDVLSASIRAADANGLLTVEQVNLLKLIELGIEPLGLNLQLFTDAMKNGLFALISSPGRSDYESQKDKKAGLDAEVSLGDVLNVVLSVANQKNAVALGPPNGNLIDLGILQVLAKASIIEAPAIGIGGIGTQAHSSNVRVFLRICLDLGGCSSGKGSLGFLSNIIKLKLDLPVVLELVNATGRIENMCHATDSQGRDMAAINVRTETAGVCIGKFNLTDAESSIHHPFSSIESCTQKINPSGQSTNPAMKTELLNISLLGLNLARLNDAVAIPALTSSETQDFAYHILDTDRHLNTKMMPEHGNPLNIGDTVKQLTDAVLTLLVGGTLGGSSNVTIPSDFNKNLANELWNKNKLENGCDVNATWNTGRNCRKDIYYESEADIEESLSGLQGFLGDLVGPLLGVLGSLVTLDIGGVLKGVLDLVGGLLGGVGEVLVGNGCYHGGLLGELAGQTGTEAGCIKNLADAMAGSSGGQPNALLVLLGQLINLLVGPLNAIGSQILNPLLELLGLNVGQAETTLLYLDCQPNVKLVH